MDDPVPTSASDSQLWWTGSRRINVFVDNESWIIPYAEELVSEINRGRDVAKFYRDYESAAKADLAFYLGCIRLTPDTVLRRHRHNLVPHASPLPKGRGFAPVWWQVLEGAQSIPICLFEAVAAVDAGPIYLEDQFHLDGHELHDEIRALQGKAAVDICLRYLCAPLPPPGRPQTGEPTFYPRRSREHDQLDPEMTIARQFDLMRVLDSNNYPAYFDYRGRRYLLRIEKEESTEGRPDA